VQSAPFGEVESSFLLVDTHWVTGEEVRDKD
jgi:hypothetical protein